MTRSHLHSRLLSRIREPRRFIQVLAGPRQVGKTTLVRQVMEACGLPAHYASADEPTLRDQAWLEQQWDLARLIESAVGAHLVNTAIGTGITVTYWRERNLEVDFVIQRGDALVAIEVKSGGRKQTLPGIAAFDKAHHPTAKLLVGGQGSRSPNFYKPPPRTGSESLPSSEESTVLASHSATGTPGRNGRKAGFRRGMSRRIRRFLRRRGS